MNIFSDNLIDEYNYCYFTYSVMKESHSEMAFLTFVQENGDGETGKEEKYYLFENATILSNWFILFGYDNNSREVLGDFELLKGINDIIPISSCKTIKKAEAFLEKENKDILGKQIKSVYTLLKPVIKHNPLIACTYARLFLLFVHINRALKSDNEDRKRFLGYIVSDCTALSEQFTKNKEIFNATRDYCNEVFQIDNEPASDMSSLTISYIYKEYCLNHGKSYYRDSPILTKKDGAEELSNAFSNMSWKEYYDFKKNTSPFDEQTVIPGKIRNLEDIAYIGIDYMLESESVLRKCKLCGKTFRTKYSSNTVYCTRPYKDTKAACNEYASRLSYKERLFQHAIHQEFTKAYNKLYGRIRRGKVPEDTPLMDQLKRLHEEYYEKYENTHVLKEREAIWKEYIEKNKKLLS